MQDCKLIAVDLAKNVFQVCVINSSNEIESNKPYKRKQFIEKIAQYKPTTIVMEACYSANYFSRLFEGYGHSIKLIPAQHVKPFVMGNKNDANDALAISEAANRPSVSFVKVKTLEQQDIQSIHRVRDRMLKQKTALTNQTRGLLSEYGIVGSKGTKGLIGLIHEAMESAKITPMFREELASLYEEYLDLTGRIKRIDGKLSNYANQDEQCQRLMSIPGIGVINATGIVSSVGDAKHFKTSRDFAVWLGLTPKQSSSGDRSTMGGITKRGDSYLRRQLIHGARAYQYRANGKNGRIDQWLKGVEERRGKHKACVALAHKLARIIWAILTKEKSWEIKAA